MNSMFLILWFAFLPPQQVNTASPPSAQSVRQVGVVAAADPASGHITIKTDAGPLIKISFEKGIRFLLVPPGTTSLDKATAISAADIAVGDRVVARGRQTGDSASFLATSILVMSKADVARKHAADRAEWEKRGVAGVITSLNDSSQEITVKTAATAGSRPLVITLGPKAVLRRYAPDSVKFTDALPSRFAELRIGDQVKALGNSNEDRSRFTAEELVSGSFRTIVATVVESDPANKTIQITDLTTNKRVEARITSDSTVRRLSAQAAQLLALRNQTPESGASSKTSKEGISRGATAPGESSQQNTQDIQSLIERLPSLSLADLKVGEALILSCTNGVISSRVTVITLLAGVEPILRASSKDGRPPDLGSWNLDLNMSVVP
jgi:hypothetical protein